MTSRYSLLVSLFFILTLLGLGWWLSGAAVGVSQLDVGKTILFTNQDCGNCRDIVAQLNQRNVPFEQRNVVTPRVQVELQQALDYCNLDTSQGIAVPVLFIDGVCHLGSSDIEVYLNQK